MNPLKNPLDGLVPLLGCKGTQFQADGKGNSVLLLFPARHLPPFRLSRSPMRRAKAMAKSHKTRWRRNGKALPSPTHTARTRQKETHPLQATPPSIPQPHATASFKNISRCKLSRTATPQPPFHKDIRKRTKRQTTVLSIPKTHTSETFEAPPNGKQHPRATF